MHTQHKIRKFYLKKAVDPARCSFTYVALLDVLEHVVVQLIEAMHLLVVEYGIAGLALEGGHAMDHIRLVLEDVVHVHILVHVGRQLGTTIDLNSEDELLTKKLLRLVVEIVWDLGLTLTISVARLKGTDKLTSLA